MQKTLLMLISAMLIATSRRPALNQSIPAFPGAEGFGTFTTGGRGGRVMEVTNLQDGGPGSFRACAEADEPRICIFRVAGLIELYSPIIISRPYITVAGQSAPGRVVLRNGPQNDVSSLLVRTHDVVIRYITIRPGPSQERSSNVDAITIANTGGVVYNVVIDHCSFSWATDENLDTWGDAHDIAIQWSIISEGLNCSSHPDGCHSCGALLGSDGGHDISFHHNLLAHNAGRNPLVKTGGVIDVVNNVIYNSVGSASYGEDDYGTIRVNYVGNYFKSGPDTDDDSYLITANYSGNGGFEIYVSGNIGPHRPTDDMDEWLVVKPKARQWLIPVRHEAPPITTVSAFEALDQVLADAGAAIFLDSLGRSVDSRDAVDRRTVNQVRNGAGHIIDDPSEVGGWPELPAGTPPDDFDHDGMPDAWEQMHGWDFRSAEDADGDGYTNLEEYLNETNPLSGLCRLYLPLVLRAVTCHSRSRC